MAKGADMANGPHRALVNLCVAFTVLIMALTPGLAQSAGVDVHAHRGGAGLAPENTLVAFRSAMAMSVEVLEMDLHVSADGEIVVIHDSTLERTTNGRGFVRNTPLAELQRLDAGSWFGARFAGERIPTLREVLETVRASGDNQVRLNLETKYEPGAPSSPPDFEARVVRLVSEVGMNRRVMIQSFHYPSLTRVKALDPSILTISLRLASDPPPDPVALVRAAQADIYSPNFRLATRAVIETLHRAGIPVVPWTVDNPAEMERLLEMGIGTLRGDGIITNYPDRLIQVLRARGLRR